VDAPYVTAVRPSDIPHRYLTRNLITGQDNRASLTQSGKKLVALLMEDFPISGAQVMDARKTGPEG
jgi:hypothetical protein